MADYDLCGWRVASDIPLSDLASWQGDARVPDIVIAIGSVTPFQAPVMATPLLQIDAAGSVHIAVEGVADYRIENGNRITVSPVLPLDAPDIGLFLLGSGLGCLCHQRGIVPIHGATVEIDGQAVVFTGDSGAGKSTIADAFSRRGYAVLADDVSPLDMSVPGGMILPSLRRIRLWADAIDHGGWQSGDLERCRIGLDKFSRQLTATEMTNALKPAALFHLRRQPNRQRGAAFRRLRGRPAVEEFSRQIYRARALTGIAGRAEATARSMRAASFFPDHFIVERPIDFTQLDAGIDDILSTVRAARAIGEAKAAP